MINRNKLEHILEYAKQQRHIGQYCKVPPEDMVEIMERLLNAGNSPVIPDGLIAAVNRLLDSDGSRGCCSAIRCHDARAEVERLLAAVPQEVQGE